MGFPTRSDIKQAVQPQKMAGSLKFQILGEEGLYYPCSENKGADQLHRYHEVDLRLVFAYAKSHFFHDMAKFIQVDIEVDRDPNRLLQPTAGWRNRARDKTTTGGQVLHLPHR